MKSKSGLDKSHSQGSVSKSYVDTFIDPVELNNNTIIRNKKGNDFKNKKILNVKKKTINDDPTHEKDAVNKKYIDNKLGDRIQLTDTTSFSNQSGVYCTLKWALFSNSIIANIFKVRRNQTPTSQTGSIASTDDIPVYFYFESGRMTNNTIACFERRDLHNISQISLTWSRHSGLSVMGKFEIVLLKKLNEWESVFLFDKDTNFSNANEWETSIVNVNFDNYGIRMVYSDADSDKSDMAILSIVLKYNVI